MALEPLGVPPADAGPNPELVDFKRRDGGMSDMSAFAEVACGAGPATTKDDVASEDGYAFQFTWELGMRYKFANGLLTGLSVLQQKVHYSETESYNNTLFFGVDDDFTALSLTVGYKF